MTEQKEQNILAEAKDQYVGDRDPANRKRNGRGVYTYDNSYFQYDGEWKNGKKHGQGKFIMGGTSNCDIYQGDFVDGEIEGRGKLTYSNGSFYEGEFSQGEKNGYGVYQSQRENYDGQWQNNMRHGSGNLQLANGDKITGTFVNHKLEGDCNIQFGDGSQYVGLMKRGLKDGYGELVDTANKFTYNGVWKDDTKHGQGIFKFDSGFTYQGEFENDQPKMVANVFVFKDLKEEIITEEHKLSDPTKKTTTGDGIIPTLEYEILGTPLTFQIWSAYQGPDILDPFQPSEEEIIEMIKIWEKENKKIKNPPPMPDFRAARMMKPPAELVQFETGRRVKLELFFIPEPEKGKEPDPKATRKLKLDYREELRIRKEQIQRFKEDQAKDAELKLVEEEQGKTAVKGKKKDTKKQEVVAVVDDMKLNLFKEDVEDNKKNIFVQNQQGTFVIQNLEFPEDQPCGRYQLIVSDYYKEKYGNIQDLVLELAINQSGKAADLKNKKKK